MDPVDVGDLAPVRVLLPLAVTSVRGAQERMDSGWAWDGMGLGRMGWAWSGMEADTSGMNSYCRLLHWSLHPAGVAWVPCNVGGLPWVASDRARASLHTAQSCLHPLNVQCVSVVSAQRRRLCVYHEPAG